MRNKVNTQRPAWLGIVLVVLGGYFLLRNFDMIPQYLPYYFFTWEMLFIFIGMVMLSTRKAAGFIFLFIGGASLLPTILDIPQIHLHDWWPVVLIAIGLSISFKKKSLKSADC